MKINGKLHSITHSGLDTYAIFHIQNLRHAEMLNELNTEDLLSLDINKAKSKRSIEQNRYMWALLHEIDEKVNGIGSNSEWDFYIEALERAGAKFDYLICKDEASEHLKKYFRAVKYIAPAENEGYGWYKCYWGSSKMNTKEMTILIDRILDMAEQAGVETTYWRSVLK